MNENVHISMHCIYNYLDLTCVKLCWFRGLVTSTVADNAAVAPFI